jgi:hypothetical protein
MSQTAPLRVRKQAVAVELALAGGTPRRVEIFVAEYRDNEFRRQDVLNLLEHIQAFLPARDSASGLWEIFNKDALLWIGVPLSPFGSEPAGTDQELYEFRRPVRVDLIGAEPIHGDLLYSARQESTRVMDYLNETGRFFRVWSEERLYLVNKAFVLRVVQPEAAPA